MDVIRIDFSPFAECIAVNSELFAINSYTECNVECIVTRYLKDALNISLDNTEFQMSSGARFSARFWRMVIFVTPLLRWISGRLSSSTVNFISIDNQMNWINWVYLCFKTKKTHIFHRYKLLGLYLYVYYKMCVYKQNTSIAWSDDCSPNHCLWQGRKSCW